MKHDYNKKTVIEGLIDYENGVTCQYRKVNKKLEKVSFNSDKFAKRNGMVFYIADDNVLKKLSQSHWSEHISIIAEARTRHKDMKFTVNELLKFTEFDKLYYVGGGSDGLFMNYKGKPITSLIHLGGIYLQVYQNIELSKSKCEEILKSLKSEFITYSSIEEIPHYNQNDKKDEHYTIELKVQLPQESYDKVFDFDSDKMKNNVWNFLKDKQ